MLAEPTSKQILAYRIGRILQIVGMVIGLEALLIFGSEPSEGPMIYTATIAVAVFYLGHWLTRRIKTSELDTRK
jgi:hypothetical protein